TQFPFLALRQESNAAVVLETMHYGTCRIRRDFSIQNSQAIAKGPQRAVVERRGRPFLLLRNVRKSFFNFLRSQLFRVSLAALSQSWRCRSSSSSSSPLSHAWPHRHPPQARGLGPAWR